MIVLVRPIAICAKLAPANGAAMAIVARISAGIGPGSRRITATLERFPAEPQTEDERHPGLSRAFPGQRKRGSRARQRAHHRHRFYLQTISVDLEHALLGGAVPRL